MKVFRFYPELEIWQISLWTGNGNTLTVYQHNSAFALRRYLVWGYCVYSSTACQSLQFDKRMAPHFLI